MSLGDLVLEVLRDRSNLGPGQGLLDEAVRQEVSSTRELTAVLRRVLEEKRESPPPVPETWYRISGLGYTCPREEVLASLTDTTRIARVTADESMTYGIGHGWHFYMQNEILGPQGILLGIWECWNCHKFYGTNQVPVLRPAACDACKVKVHTGEKVEEVPCNRFVYQELYLRNEEYRIHGHPDGILVLDGKRKLLELKTINESWFKKKIDMAPLPEHAIQTNIYMHLLGLREGLIVYHNKGGYGLRSIKEFEIEYDQALVNSVLSTLTTFRRAFKSGDLPPRLVACDRPATPQVKECLMGKTCFSCKSRLGEAA